MPDGQDVLASLLAASAGAWQLSDGRGALARGTRSGAPTRRGHALLAAPQVGPRAELPAVALLRFDDPGARGGGGPFGVTPRVVIAARGGGVDPLDPDAGAMLTGEDAFLPGWVQCPLAGPGAALHIVASPEEQLFRVLATEARLGVPPARTLAECLERLDLAEGERKHARQKEALAGAADTAKKAAAAHSSGPPAGGPPEPPPTAFLASLVARLQD